MVASDVRLPSWQSSLDAPNALMMWHMLRPAAIFGLSGMSLLPIPELSHRLGGGFDGKSAGEGHLAEGGPGMDAGPQEW